MATMASPPAPSPYRPTPDRRRRHRRRLAAAVALAAGSLVGASTACTNDGPRQVAGGHLRPASTTPTTAVTTEHQATTTTAALTPEDRIAAAYREAKAVFFDVLMAPSRPDERLAQTRIEPDLIDVQNLMRRLTADRIAVRYPNGRRPVVTVRSVDVHGPTATVLACQVDNAVQVNVTNGSVADDDVVSALDRAEMVFTSRRWKVRYQTRLKVWADRKGCDR